MTRTHSLIVQQQVYLLEVRYIGKQLMRIHAVGVNLVEVAQQYLLPKDKLLKTLSLWIVLLIDLVKPEQQRDVVGPCFADPHN